MAQSIERGHEAVKQVVVRAPESSTLLRKLGGTGTSGTGVAAPTRRPGPRRPMPGRTTIEMASSAAPAEETERLEISAVAGAPATERLDATTLPMQPAGPSGRAGSPRRFSWTTIAGTAAIVFVLALLFITAVELISGKPLAAIFGGRRHRDDGQEHLHAVAVAVAVDHADDLDHDDHHDDDLVHDDLVHDDGDQHDHQHDAADEHHHDDRARGHDHHHRPAVGVDDDPVVGVAVALRSRATSP